MFPDVSALLTCLLITGTQWRKSWIGHPLSVIRLAAGYTGSPWDASAKSHQGCTTVNTMYSKVEECQQTWGSCQTATQAGEVIPCCLSHTSMYRGLAAALKVKKQSSRALNEFFFLQTKVEKDGIILKSLIFVSWKTELGLLMSNCQSIVSLLMPTTLASVKKKQKNVFCVIQQFSETKKTKTFNFWPFCFWL